MLCDPKGIYTWSLSHLYFGGSTIIWVFSRKHKGHSGEGQPPSWDPAFVAPVKFPPAAENFWKPNISTPTGILGGASLQRDRVLLEGGSPSQSSKAKLLHPAGRTLRLRAPAGVERGPSPGPSSQVPAVRSSQRFACFPLTDPPPPSRP